METIIQIIQFILCFSLLVFVHEGGHFLFAKLFKIRVEKFYLFFNPWFSLFKFTYKGTEYGMGWIPFGGYVSIAGMIDETKDSSDMESEPQEWEFRSKPAWQRLLVMVGGVLMNIITAIVIFICISYSQGSSYIAANDVKDGYQFTETAKEIGFINGDKILTVNGESFENYVKYREAIIIGNAPKVTVERDGEKVDIQIEDKDVPKLLADQLVFDLRVPFGIDSIATGSPLDMAGVVAGDSIVSINNNPIKYVDQVNDIAAKFAGKEVDLILCKADSKQLDTIKLNIAQDSTLGVFSFSNRMLAHYNITQHDYTLLESIPRGFVLTANMCSSYLKQMRMIFNPETEAYKSVGSVLTMGNLFPKAWDWIFFWNITALFSVILAIMNLLPIPALDGGHVLFLLVEVITRRKPSDKFLERAQTIGFYLLMGIMVLAMWNDIMKFFIN